MLKALIKYLQRRRIYRETYDELSKLSSSQLRDIGIERYMISRIAAETAYGKDQANA